MLRSSRSCGFEIRTAAFFVLLVCAAVARAEAQSAEVSLTLTDSPDPVISGTTFTYTITVVNAGPNAAASVTITANLPPGTTVVSLQQTSGPAWILTVPPGAPRGPFTATNASLAAGTTSTFALVATVNSGIPEGFVFSNTAFVTSTTADPNSSNNVDTETTTARQVADLAVTKTDTPDPASALLLLTYRITVTNNGPSDAIGVAITDALPSNTSFVVVRQVDPFWLPTLPASGTGGTFTAQTPSFRAGDTKTFELLVTVDPFFTRITTLTNGVGVGSGTTDPNPGNNTDTETTSVLSGVDLAVTMSDSPDPVAPGSNLTYTVGVTNNGPADTNSASVLINVGFNTGFVSFQQISGPTYSLVGQPVGGTLTVTASPTGIFPAGATSTFTLVVNVNAAAPAGSTITNSAFVGRSFTDPVDANNTAFASTAVASPVPALTPWQLVVLAAVLMMIALAKLRARPARPLAN